MAKAERWIKDKAAATLQPAQVETALGQILKNWPESASPLVELIEQFPLGESALLHLLAISSICATRLQRNPEILLWLAEPEVSLARRGFAQMSNDLHIFTADSVAAEDFRLLRLWKGREMVRVALREIAKSHRSKKRPPSYRTLRRSVFAVSLPIGTRNCAPVTVHQTLS